MNEIELKKHKYNVRRAEIKDIEEIANIYRNNFKEHILVHKGIITNLDYLNSRLNNTQELWAIIETEEKISGVAALAIHTDVGLGEIERVCIDILHRGNGCALELCTYLLDEAKNRDLGFVEAYARGDQISMQKTFLKLNMKVYGVAPRFEIIHDNKIVREEFVHMGIVLKPESIDTKSMNLVESAKEMYNLINRISVNF